MIKLIVMDLDGTLFLGHGKTIFDLSKESIEALNLLKQNNITILIASGRAPKYIEKLCKLYDLSLTYAGYNGSLIYDDNNLVVKKTLDFQTVLSIQQLLEQSSLKYDVSFIQNPDSSRALSDPSNHHFLRYQKLMEQEKAGALLIEKDFKTYLKENQNEVAKLSILAFDTKNASEIMNYLKDHLTSDFSVTCASKIFVEVTAKNGTKGDFIQYLYDKYGYQETEIATVGDAFNDLSMFEKTKYSYLIKSGEPTLSNQVYKVVNNVLEATIDIIKENKNA